jgi:hypothetical protein
MPEQSTQAATSAPTPTPTTIDDAEPDLPTGLTARPMQPPGAVDEVIAQPGQAGFTKNGHARAGSNLESSSSPSARHAWMTGTRAEPGIEALVEILVRTVPRGASVGALGTDARCEPTPCALLVPKDRAVTLRAEARNTSVQKTFTFTDESEVELRLSNARTKASASAEPSSSALTKPAQVPHAPSDLKVPSIFRER